MYRIDNSTAATTLPTPGAVGPNPNGYFTKGDPASGIPATIVDDDWANALQEELANAIVGSGQTLSKTNRSQLAQALQGRILGQPISFTSSGTYVPSAVARLICVRAVGGGGAGAGSAASGSSSCTACSGGGAGSYVEAWFLVSALGASVSVGIGGGATGGPGSGNTGGTTTIGSFLSLPGGIGGGAQAYGLTVTNYSAQGTGGGAPTVSGALYSRQQHGQSGACGIVFSGNCMPGQGGVSPLGAGGPNIASGAGIAASGYGAGGGGAGVPANTGPFNGGNGSPGYVEITEYS